jgi:hypothetical protein
MLKWLKIAQHHHTGRLRPHEHTSYLPLLCLLIAVGIALSSYTAYATGTPAVPGPTAGSVSLSGEMPSKPPTVAATIKVPTNGQHFSTSPDTVSGTCVADDLVEIFKNDIFAGSTACSDTGTYSIDVDLLIGQNVLIARVYDALNQPGPDSNSVTAYYDALPTQSSALASLNFGSGQLLINTDAVFRGAFPGEPMSIPLDIIGGTPAYAVNIQWGDSQNSVISRNDNVEFTSDHTYTKPGTYDISVQATDANGLVGFITVAAIVNGQPSVVATTLGSSSSGTTAVQARLLALWPLYVSSVAVVGSFYLGERREKKILARVPIYYK